MWEKVAPLVLTPALQALVPVRDSGNSDCEAAVVVAVVPHSPDPVPDPDSFLDADWAATAVAIRRPEVCRFSTGLRLSLLRVRTWLRLS